MRGERMPQSVTADMLGDSGGACGVLYPADQEILVDVVTPDDAGPWVHRALVGRKDKLPPPFVGRSRVFSRERVRQLDIAVAFGTGLRNVLAGVTYAAGDGLTGMTLVEGEEGEEVATNICRLIFVNQL